MDTSNNGLDAFERSLRESLDQYEVPYNSTDWAQMDRALSGERRGGWIGGMGAVALIAGLAVAGGAVWFALGQDTEHQASATHEASSEATTGRKDGTRSTKAGVAGDAGANALPKEHGADTEEQDLLSSRSTEEVAMTRATRPAVESNERGSTAIGQAGNTPKGSTPSQTGMASKGPNPDEVTFMASVGQACPGTAVEFKVSNMPEDGIYLWNFGDGSFSNKANPEHTFTKPGTYQVMLSMSAAGVGTIQNKPSSDVIVIHEAPMAAFNVLKQEYDGHLPSVHFENRSLAGKQYRWDFGDGQTSTIAHPDHIYKKKGVYHVELTVTNEIGCEDKIMKDVRIEKDYNLDAPASFSPNGDNVQDAFIPEALRSLGVKFHLAIYAPSGALMYETSEASKPWMGKLNNRGEVLPAGEYVWVVDVRESLHLAETYTGKVMLER